MKHELHLRPTVDLDEALLFQIFVGTRPDIANAIHIAQEVRQQLMVSQFNAQRKHYLEQFPKADFAIIQYGNTSIGRLDVNRTKDELHIIEFAILDEYRGQGIGSTLLKAIQEEARLTHRVVRIHVEKQNPALTLYKRNGFQRIGDKPMHWEMRWTPGSVIQAQA